MGRKNNRYQRQAAARLAAASAAAHGGAPPGFIAAPAAQASSAPGMDLVPASGGPALARQSPQRNHVVELPRRERLQLTGENRRRIVRKTTALFTDVPYLRGACKNVASYLGPIMPRPATLDVEWNRLARAAWDEYLRGNLWDASGKYSFEGWQEQMQIYTDRDGDCLVVFTEDEEAEGGAIPTHRLIPALAVDNPPVARARAEGWQDGVRIGTHHRHLAWHVLREESGPEFLTQGMREGFVIPRHRGWLFANWDAVGHARGTTRFVASGNTIIDMQMMDAATHQLFNLAARIGLSLTSEAGAPKPPGPRPLENRLLPQPVPAAIVPAEGQEPPDIRRYQEEFMGEGPAVVELEPGQAINMHALERDLPDLREIKGSDFERIAMAYELPVQTLFCIFSGIFNLTGPGFRVSMAKSRLWRAQQLAKREPLIYRAYARVMEWMIRTKQLPLPKKDFRWWRCETSYAADFTIDEGRDIKADLMRLQMGITSPQELAREHGRDVMEVLAETMEWLRAVTAGLKAHNLPVTFFFPKEGGARAEEPDKKENGEEQEEEDENGTTKDSGGGGTGSRGQK